MGGSLTTLHRSTTNRKSLALLWLCDGPKLLFGFIVYRFLDPNSFSINIASTQNTCKQPLDMSALSTPTQTVPMSGKTCPFSYQYLQLLVNIQRCNETMLSQKEISDFSFFFWKQSFHEIKIQTHCPDAKYEILQF